MWTTAVEVAEPLSSAAVSGHRNCLLSLVLTSHSREDETKHQRKCLTSQTASSPAVVGTRAAAAAAAAIAPHGVNSRPNELPQVLQLLLELRVLPGLHSQTKHRALKLRIPCHIS